MKSYSKTILHTRKKFRQCLIFLFSCYIGFLISSSVNLSFNEKSIQINIQLQKVQNTASKNDLYDETLSQKLYNDVKVLCFVLTFPPNHKTKAIHMKNLWGKKCNKLLFITSQEDPELGEVVKFAHINDTRGDLWNKTKATMMHLYENYLNDYDFFLKSDDDIFIIMENLRYMLAQYNSNTAFYFGNRYAIPSLDEGYMSGGGYVLSRKALEKLGKTLLHNHTICKPVGSAEDLHIGQCLSHSAIFVDDRDELQQKRFFSVGAAEHYARRIDYSYWYWRNLYYSAQNGNLNCCSDVPVAFHISARELLKYDYLSNRVDLFGVSSKVEEYPRKLKLEDIIKASDMESTSPNYRKRIPRHDLEESEIY